MVPLCTKLQNPYHKANRIDELFPWNVADRLRKSAAPPMGSM